MTIDANMYWLPEELFTNEKMLAEFMKLTLSELTVSQVRAELDIFWKISSVLLCLRI